MLMTRTLDVDWMVKRTRSQSGDWRVRLSFPAENWSDKRENGEKLEDRPTAIRSSKFRNTTPCYFKMSMRYTDCVKSYTHLYLFSFSHFQQNSGTGKWRADSPVARLQIFLSLPSNKSCLVYQFSGRWFLPRKLSFTGKRKNTLFLGNLYLVFRRQKKIKRSKQICW